MHYQNVTSTELKRWLERRGCTFEPAKGSHLRVRLGGRSSILPVHGSGKEVGKGLGRRIRKDLGLK
ncbi:putative mRNA interferase HicA [Candidatus Sulfopaludibacter sp. SbA4]|nr:putative mRNA interferase HicA [Candidatus Sulfopaludibacter sp. SbA4]